jgi:hypothetical protein
LQASAVCLVIERNNEIAFTRMVARRDARPIYTDGLFGLDYEAFYNSETAGGNTLYFFGKGSVNLSLFSEAERRTMVAELQAMMHYLIFYIAGKITAIISTAISIASWPGLCKSKTLATVRSHRTPSCGASIMWA